MSSNSAQEPQEPDGHARAALPPVVHHGSGDINQARGNIIVNKAAPPPLPVPRQLPMDIPRFTGRSEELAVLDAFLTSRRTQPGAVSVAVIDGTAGVGKTAFGVHWANGVRDRFPDGQLYVDMHGYSHDQRMQPFDALGSFLLALDVPREKIPLTVDERAALYRTKTAGRQMLVFVDNVDTADQVRHLLPGEGESLVIVTSRSKLRGLGATTGVHRLTVLPLPNDDARALLQAIVGVERADGAKTAVRDIARLCGHLPLALCIVAERVSTDEYTPLAVVAAELDDERKRLGVLVTDEPDKAVRAAFSWSYRALPDPIARIFRILGLHPGPQVSGPVVAALADCSIEEADRALGYLARFNMLAQVGQRRYSFHDLLKVYSVELTEVLDALDSRVSVLSRTLDFYLHSAAAAEGCFSSQRRRVPIDEPTPGSRPLTFAEPGAALEWCEAERANLTAAARAALAGDQLAIAWKLPVYLGFYFYIRKHWHDWESTHQDALVAAERLGDRVARAWVLNSLGNLRYDLQDFKEAITYHNQAMILRRDDQDINGEAIGLLNLGEDHRGLKRYEDATALFKEAATMFRQVPDVYGEAMAMSNLANAWREDGRLEEALTATFNALALRRTAEDAHGEAFTLNNLGDVYREMRRFTEAEAALREALAIRQRLHDDHNAAVTWYSLGAVARDAGRREEAIHRWERAAAILDIIDPERASVVREHIMELGAP